MTIYFKEHDWTKLKAKLHQMQKLTGEFSELGHLVDDCLEILETTDRDEAAEDNRQEKAIAAKATAKKNPSKTGGEGVDYWIS